MMTLKINPKHLQDLLLRNQHQLNNNSHKSILGIDYGAKFCGIAFSPDGICVFPVGVYSTEQIEDQISKEIVTRDIKKVVIGLPISPNKKENKICQVIRQFGKILKKKHKIEVTFQDEKFSTQEGLKFKSKKEKRADHLAAAKILEYYLGY